MSRGKILRYQNVILKKLSGKIDDFYLAGGTALSLFYFQHRLSLDLDFFTKNFSSLRIEEIITYLKDTLKVKIRLTRRSLEAGKTKMVVYSIYLSPKEVLKIDFVEDILSLINRPKAVEGINILSLEDIYLRKIYTLAGAVESLNEIGRKKFIGGRAETKDFYDLYFLSHTFMPLSKFVDKYGDAIIKEGLIRWFRTFDRMQMKDGILTLDVHRKADYQILERHFKKEIDKILEKQIGMI